MDRIGYNWIELIYTLKWIELDWIELKYKKNKLEKMQQKSNHVNKIDILYMLDIMTLDEMNIINHMAILDIIWTTKENQNWFICMLYLQLW